MRERMRKIFVVFLSLIIITNGILGKEVIIEKKFKIGSEEKKEELFFLITDIKADRDGNIFVLDFKGHTIKKFSKDGKFIKEAGGKGQGPGELDSPSHFAIDEKGNIWVAEIRNRRISIFDNSLNFIKSIKLMPWKYPRSMDFDINGNIVIYYFPPQLMSKYHIHVYDRTGKYIKSFFEEVLPDRPKPRKDSLHTPYMGSIDVKNNLIAFAHFEPSNPYIIYILNTNGQVIRKFGRKIPGYKFPKKLVELSVKKIKSVAEIQRIMDSIEKLIVIAGVHFTKENHVVVQLSETYREKGIKKTRNYLDIFSLDGTLIKKDIKFGPETIMDIDENNNIYTFCIDEVTPSFAVYSLKIKD
ncbi:NHL repeat-containing protein [Candidatus Aminicenantes bacterium AC-335-B20]|nr:NHL repeat-containing protein [SCandidatus Aminicenantes bacterium Aminicenantia_JdfR_composite]MCP2596313.1 NHL repeat-containing protein [Candidatus Aminicenantes bacterium AC-335-G13]MCP2599076.1 NHL repeat-containing protein [Candidatus Aminicenantes bacterium AC-335-B20]